jgi:hypothetical protein
MIVREHLYEGIYYDDGEFVFNFKEDNASHFINLKYNNTYVKENNKHVFYSYTFKRTTDKNIKKLFLKALKYKDKTLIKENDYDLFLKKAVMGLLREIDRDIDIIVYPKSSSPLNSDIAFAIKNRLGHNTFIAQDLIIKNNIENIIVDKSKISDKTAKRLMISAGKDGEVTLKNIPPQFRKYFSNFLKFDSEIQRNYLNKLRGNVLIVDDILAKGTTMIEVENLIRSLNPTSVVKYALLKS